MSLFENIPFCTHIILVYIETSFTIMANISYNKRKQIISMHEDDLTGRKIAKGLIISHGSVQNNIKNLKQNGSVNIQPKINRPRSLSVREERKLISASMKKPY